MRQRRYAAMDLGTNSARLAVVDVDDAGAWHLVADERIACRLGQNLERTGRLHPAARIRAVDALRVLTNRARELEVEALRAVATYALRTAMDGPEFQAHVRVELGLDLEILSGDAEARWVLRGARRHAAQLPFGALTCLDLGGGSLELAREAEPAPLAVSLPLGAVVTAAELPIPAPEAAIAALRRAARQALRTGAPAFERTATEPFAAGGTITAAARFCGALAPLSGHTLSRDEVEAMLARIAPLDLESRRRLPRLDPDRADIIVSGLAVLAETMQHMGSASLRVHEHGVREGLLAAMVAGEGRSGSDSMHRTV